MKTTADFLDAMRAKLDLPSDGKLADYLGMHRQHVSRYRVLGGSFDDEMSIRVADILDIDAAYVVACMHYQRTKVASEKKLWERIAETMAGVAAALVVVMFMPAVGQFDNTEIMRASLIAATTAVQGADSLYIMRISALPLLLLVLVLGSRRFTDAPPQPLRSVW